jgi:hypothetical protein
MKIKGDSVMPYNREISHKAPFPTGPLPTHEELGVLVRRANEARARAVVRSIGRLFGSKRA